MLRAELGYLHDAYEKTQRIPFERAAREETSQTTEGPLHQERRTQLSPRADKKGTTRRHVIRLEAEKEPVVEEKRPVKKYGRGEDMRGVSSTLTFRRRTSGQVYPIRPQRKRIYR